MWENSHNLYIFRIARVKIAWIPDRMIILFWQQHLLFVTLRKKAKILENFQKLCTLICTECNLYHLVQDFYFQWDKAKGMQDATENTSIKIKFHWQNFGFSHLMAFAQVWIIVHNEFFCIFAVHCVVTNMNATILNFVQVFCVLLCSNSDKTIIINVKFEGIHAGHQDVNTNIELKTIQFVFLQANTYFSQ